MTQTEARALTWSLHVLTYVYACTHLQTHFSVWADLKSVH